MNTIVRRRLLQIMGAGGLTAAAVACTPDEDSGSGTGSGGSDGGGGSGNGLEFIWPGTSDPETAVANDLKAAMGEQGTEIEYNFLSWNDMQQQLSVRIQANDAPDLTMTQDVTDWVAMGALASLDERTADIDTSLFRPGTLEYSTMDGSLYALPYSAQSWTLVVNRELAEAAGIDPEGIATYEDMEAAAAELTGDGTYGFCIPMQNPRFAFRTFMTAAYANGFNPGDYAEPETEKWVQTLDHLRAFNDLRPDADKAWAYPEMFRSFANGETAMIAAGSFYTANVYELSPEIVGSSVQIPYPTGPSGSDKSVPISNAGFALFEGSENQDAGWTVMEELLKPEWQARLTAVAHAPATTDITIDDLRPWIEQYYPDAVEGHIAHCEAQMRIADERGTELQKIPGQPAIEPEFQIIFNEFIGGSIDAEEAVEKMSERFGSVAG